MDHQMQQARNVGLEALRRRGFGRRGLGVGGQIGPRGQKGMGSSRAAPRPAPISSRCRRIQGSPQLRKSQLRQGSGTASGRLFSRRIEGNLGLGDEFRPRIGMIDGPARASLPKRTISALQECALCSSSPTVFSWSVWLAANFRKVVRARQHRLDHDWFADWWPERRCPRSHRSSMTRQARRGRDSPDPERPNLTPSGR